MTAQECPVCAGLRLLRDPTGLRITHTSVCRLGTAEDATQVADDERLRVRRSLARPATAAEVELLTALGHPPPLTTHVRRLAGHLRERGWPTITLDPPVGGNA